MRHERAPAKLNLVLLVGPREASGYHGLRTLFCAIELADELAVRFEGRTSDQPVELVVEGARIGPVRKNLAFRAARAFLDAAGGPGTVSMTLRKRIPAGGGLGGGSSDAAAVLRALDRLCPETVPPDRLMELAATLGSDVPFFLTGAPLAWGAGRGERLEPLPPLPTMPVLLVFPRFPIETAEAYGWLDQDRGSSPKLRTAIQGPRPPDPASWEAVAALSRNDFEESVFRRYPELAEIREALAEAGATLARLSGSGSTLFGVFHDDATRDRAAALITTRFPGAETNRTRTAGAGEGFAFG